LSLIDIKQENPSSVRSDDTSRQTELTKPVNVIPFPLCEGPVITLPSHKSNEQDAHNKNTFTFYLHMRACFFLTDYFIYSRGLEKE
jgi:hypothetical protein